MELEFWLSFLINAIFNMIKYLELEKNYSKLMSPSKKSEN